MMPPHPRLEAPPGTSVSVSLNLGIEPTEFDEFHSNDRLQLVATDGLGDEDITSTDSVSVVSSVDHPKSETQVALYDKRVALENLRQARSTLTPEHMDEDNSVRINDLKRRYALMCKDPKIKKAIKKCN